jgi:CRP-like cAMP-binding protein
MFNELRGVTSQAALRPVSCCACDMFELCEWAEQQRRMPGVHRAVLRTLRRNETLTEIADGAFFFAVRKGLLKAIRTSVSGGKRVSHIYVPGDLIPAELLQAGPGAIELVAVTDAMVCTLDKDTVVRICKMEPTSHAAVQWLLARNRSIRTVVDDSRCAAKLEQFLKRISNRLRARGLDDIDVLAHLTQQDVADILQVNRGAVRKATKARRLATF